MKYLGRNDFEHAAMPAAGVVLVNLGTPDAPDSTSVRRYLAEFLADPRVVEMPRWLWRIILHGVILRLRPRRSAHAYRQIWTDAGSPLLVNTQRLADRVEERLRDIAAGSVLVRCAMRYGRPALRSVLRELHGANVQRLIVVPLYPQYSATTTASVFDAVADELKRWRWIPEVQFVSDYYRRTDYIQVLADSVRRHWAAHGRRHLLMSFHGIPERYLHAGDPYHCHCHATARRLAAALELGSDDWTLSFQSRVGRERWLQPYTDAVLAELPKRGVRALDVICPGFAADCLETLEEIAISGRAQFITAGGEALDYIPALNDSAEHAALIAQIVRERSAHWPEFSVSATQEASSSRTLTVERFHTLSQRQ